MQTKINKMYLVFQIQFASYPDIRIFISGDLVKKLLYIKLHIDDMYPILLI